MFDLVYLASPTLPSQQYNACAFSDCDVSPLVMAADKLFMSLWLSGLIWKRKHMIKNVVIVLMRILFKQLSALIL